jgi:hypothetical protein
MMSVKSQILYRQIVGKVSDKNASMLIDTGSSVTIVRQDFADQDTMVPAGGVSVTSATGDRVDIIGKCDFRMKIGKNTDIVCNAFVARGFLYDCILGLDILKDCACYIDVANDSLYINESAFHFVQILIWSTRVCKMYATMRI